MRRACLGCLLLLAPEVQAQPAPSVDLVHHLGLIVQVSSTVGNGRDLPTHLIDGDLGTAWSSRTGELVGARVSTSLPDDAEVTAIALTAGFTRTTPRDLFRMNPRVARIAIARNGVVLQEVALDVENPGLQTFPVSGRGGRWSVQVREVRLGTRPTWQEVSLSELRILGRAPSRTHPAAQVWVEPGARDARRTSVAIQGPWRSAAAYCAEQAQGEPERCHSPYREAPAQSVCGCGEAADEGTPRGVTQLPAAQGPVRAAAVRRVTEDVHGLDPCVLLLETARGTFVVHDFATCGEPRIAHDYGIITHVDAMTVALRPDGGATLTLRIREQEDRADMSEAGGPPGQTFVRRVTLTVRVNAAGDVYDAVRVGAPR